MDFGQALYFVFMWLSVVTALLAICWIRLSIPFANVAVAVPVLLLGGLVSCFLFILCMTEISNRMGGATTTVVFVTLCFVLMVGLFLLDEYSVRTKALIKDDYWTTKRTFMCSIFLSALSFSCYKIAHAFI